MQTLAVKGATICPLHHFELITSHAETLHVFSKTILSHLLTPFFCSRCTLQLKFVNYQKSKVCPQRQQATLVDVNLALGIETVESDCSTSRVRMDSSKSVNSQIYKECSPKSYHNTKFSRLLSQFRR